MLIGITGCSGAGKSFVAEFLKKELDAEVLKFDKISHSVVLSEEYKTFVKEKVSQDVFSNNEIDRKKLGALLWKDKSKLKLVNKFAEEKMIKIIDKKLQKTSKKYVILDYALLPLMKYFNFCDFTILVKSEKNIRFDRLMLRENITKDYFEARENHLPNFENFEYDFIFENNNANSPSVIVNKIKEKLC